MECEKKAGGATLHFATPFTRYVLLVIQVGLWVVAIRRFCPVLQASGYQIHP